MVEFPPLRLLTRKTIYTAEQNANVVHKRSPRFYLQTDDLQKFKSSMLQENNPDAAYMNKKYRKEGKSSVVSYRDWKYRRVLHASHQLLKLLCEWLYIFAGKILLSSF